MDQCGDRVRLNPKAGGDIFDLALKGKIAAVESIEQDYEGKLHVCVVLDDDPGRDIGLMRQPGHWMRQAFFVGRPKLLVSRVVEAMQANGQSIEDAAKDWSLPVAAVEEALDYYRRFRDLIEADAADELALSKELAQRRPPVS